MGARSSWSRASRRVEHFLWAARIADTRAVCGMLAFPSKVAKGMAPIAAASVGRFMRAAWPPSLHARPDPKAVVHQHLAVSKVKRNSGLMNGS
jgi:hypothetical protein